MTKEIWLFGYEVCTEEIMDVEEMDREGAQRELDSILEHDPYYVDNFIKEYEIVI